MGNGCQPIPRPSRMLLERDSSMMLRTKVAKAIITPRAMHTFAKFKMCSFHIDAA